MWTKLNSKRRYIQDFEQHMTWLAKSHAQKCKSKSIAAIQVKGFSNFGESLAILSSGLQQVEEFIEDAIKSYDGAIERGIKNTILKEKLRKSLTNLEYLFDTQLSNFPSWDFETPFARKIRSDMWASYREDLEGRMSDLSRASPPPFPQRHPAVWAISLMILGSIIPEAVKLAANFLGKAFS